MYEVLPRTVIIWNENHQIPTTNKLRNLLHAQAVRLRRDYREAALSRVEWIQSALDQKHDPAPVYYERTLERLGNTEQPP